MCCWDWSPQLNLPIPEISNMSSNFKYMQNVFIYTCIHYIYAKYIFKFSNFCWSIKKTLCQFRLNGFKRLCGMTMRCSSGRSAAKWSINNISIIFIIIICNIIINIICNSIIVLSMPQTRALQDSHLIAAAICDGAANLNFISGNLLNLLRFLMTRLFYGNDMCVCAAVTGHPSVPQGHSQSEDAPVDIHWNSCHVAVQ